MEDQSHNELSDVQRLRGLARYAADLLYTIGRFLGEKGCVREAEQCIRISARLLIELEQITESGAADE